MDRHFTFLMQSEMYIKSNLQPQIVFKIFWEEVGVFGGSFPFPSLDWTLTSFHFHQWTTHKTTFFGDIHVTRVTHAHTKRPLESFYNDVMWCNHIHIHCQQKVQPWIVILSQVSSVNVGRAVGWSNVAGPNENHVQDSPHPQTPKTD